MLGPMMKQGAMEEAWAQESGMRPPMPMGVRPPLGATMQDQLRRHVDGRMGELGGEAGFFDGPMQLPVGGGQMGADWAREFAGSGPAGPSSGLMMPPHAGMRPPGAEWAEQFARQPMHPAEMDAAFREAQMAHRSASSSAGPQQAAGGPMAMGPMSMGPMAMGPMPMMPMMGQMGPMMGRPAYGAQADWQPPPSVQEAKVEPAAPEAQQEEPKVMEDRAHQDQADLGQAAQMVEMLRNSGNPKFANSKFVSFIDKVSKGELQFEENTVVDRDGVQVDWEALYDTEAATATDAERKELEKLFAASGGSGLGGLQEAWKGDPDMENAWEMAKEAAMKAGMSEGSMDELWRQMQEEAGDFGDEGFMMDPTLQRGMFQEDAFNSAKKMSAYEFSKDNQYMEAEDPLALAQRLIREGRDREAVLALEAEVQRNPENSEGWRQLGQLYADMDQDVEAIQCLRKGHEVDPYNLDSLLALGVSCTNELDRLEALRYLREWMENHEEFQVLTQDLQPPGNFEYEAWREQVTGLLNRAAQANPLDADVFVALGVMENINFNYDAAIAALATACRLRPNDHTCWNKLGATLANSGGRDGASKAVVAYHQGLQLKPNYARSWSNLAIAHAQLGEHNDAARFYLSSLVLNPQATHIWNFLHSAVLNMNNTLPLEEANAAEGDKKAALEAVDGRDLEACTRVIRGVLDPQALPARMQELPQPPEEILGSMGL